MGRKREKSEQRKSYREAFRGIKHGHGGWLVKKRAEAALGK